MVSINVNNLTKKIAKGTTLNLLLRNINQKENGIAVAVNNQIITKSDWASTLLIENDEVLIIQATQGG
ncbi:MAG: sulfur carrier protein ThiS [Flavobacteriaceae bacterium]